MSHYDPFFPWESTSLRHYPIEPPCVWPDEDAFDLINEHGPVHPVTDPIQSATRLFAVVNDLDNDGLSWFKDWLNEVPQPKGKLVVTLYPGCATSAGVLKELYDLPDYSSDCLDIRVLPHLARGHLPQNVSVYFGEGGRNLVSTGPLSNFGCVSPRPAQANLFFNADASLIESWRHWFHRVWAGSAPLTPEALDLPDLISAREIYDPPVIWMEYGRRCYGFTGGPEPSADAAGAAQVGSAALSTTNTDGPSRSTPTREDDLGIPIADELEQRIDLLYRLGRQVIPNRGSRLLPFDAPIQPEWLGITAQRRMGLVSRTVSHRVSALSKEDLAKVERARRKTAELLPKFSVSWGEGSRWMPDTVRPLFEEEMELANEEAKGLLRDLLSEDPDQFIGKRRAKIAEDLESAYREFHPTGEPEEKHVQAALDELKRRFKGNSADRLVTTVTFHETRFRPEPDTISVSSWEQPLVFLTGLAEYVRKALSDRFFFRGLHVDEEDLLGAMNVADDHLLGEGYSLKVASRAREELNGLKFISDSQAEDREKCRALLDLLGGTPIQDLLTRLEKKEGVVR